MIDNEINNANQGKKAEICLKVNNLVDQSLIRRLYAASNAGVKIKLIIRGMCSLKPAIPNLSENIQAISIVDRFLEHPRVYMFHNNGDEKIYLSSADWMTRNLDGRIEVGCPVYAPRLKEQLKTLFEIQFRDTTKARIIDAQQQNLYVQRGNRKKLRSQRAIYDYLKKYEEQVEQELITQLGSNKKGS